MGHLGLAPLFLTPDLSTEVSSQISLLLCSKSHLLSLVNWLHTVKECFFLILKQVTVKHETIYQKIKHTPQLYDSSEVHLDQQEAHGCKGNHEATSVSGLDRPAAGTWYGKGL